MTSLILLDSAILLFLIFFCVISLFAQFINTYFSILALKHQKWIVVMELVFSVYLLHTNVEFMILVNEAKRGNIQNFSFIGVPGDVIIRVMIVSTYVIGIRAVALLISKYHKMKNSVNGLTVKYVMDTLDDGIIFVNEKKQRIFTNLAMYEICERIFGENYQLKRDFWSEIETVPQNNSFKKRKIEDKFLFRFPDHTYEFSKENIWIKGKFYTRYLASDVIKRDLTLQKLEIQTSELEQATKELVWMLDNMEQIKKEEAISKMMRHLHDVCAQRVSIIRQTMLSKKEMDYVYLEEMLENFSEEMKHGLDEEPSEKFQDIQTSFRNIGVEVTMHGKIPKENKVQGVFCDVVREAVTNALRHGNAKKVDVFIKEMRRTTKIEIYNDGDNTEDVLIEGNGIKGMRENIEAIHGSLEIVTKPKFKILIYLYKE